jgi:hypothetical protein
MKNLSILALLLFSNHAIADTKLSQLPLGSGAATTSTDSFPYVDSTTDVTQRLTLFDIPNIPAFSVFPRLNQPNTYTAGPQSLGVQVQTIQLANDTSTGTTAHKLAKLTAAGKVVITATTDSSGVIGIVAAGAGTVGNADIAQVGQEACIFDNGTTAGDYVQISSSSGGECHDSGSSLPASGQVVGRVLSTNGSAGTYLVVLFMPSVSGSGGGGSVSSVQAADGSTTPIYGWSGGPITGSGTLTQTLLSQSANMFFAGPTSGSGQPAFRLIVAADVPVLNQNTTGNSGTATALASVPTQCTGGQVATGIATSGNANCTTVGSPLTFSDSLIQSGSNVTLVNDSATPPASSYYGTNGSATLGYFTLPSGFVNPMTTLGDMISGGASGAPSRVIGNTTATKKFLTQTGTGSASAAPNWNVIAGVDLPLPGASSLGGVESITCTNQFVSSISTGGAPACTTVAYSQVSGTPTLFYQTIQSNTTAQTQEPALNFSTNFTSTDTAATRTTINLASTISSNTSGNAATATALAATPSQCPTGQYATGVTAAGTANCTAFIIESVSIQWSENNTSPISSFENGLLVYYFQSALTQVLNTVVHVPTSYFTGNQIRLRFPFYDGDSTGTALLQTVATLIRSGTDVIISTTNQRTSTNTAVTLSSGTSSIPQQVAFDLTDSTGKINSVSVSPGDSILVSLKRGTDTGTGIIKAMTYAAEATFQ